MLEQWLDHLGARVTATIHSLNSGGWGYAEYGPPRKDEWDVGYVPALRLRYNWEGLHIGWGPSFDRWANSLDWIADVPGTIEELAWILREAILWGDAGYRCEKHDYRATKLVPPTSVTGTSEVR